MGIHTIRRYFRSTFSSITSAKTDWKKPQRRLCSFVGQDLSCR